MKNITMTLEDAKHCFDFLSKKLLYRIHPSRLRKELLIRALGHVASWNACQVVDATAGLGRDSLILAAMGCQVTLLERSSVLYRLLNDALECAKADLIAQPNLQAIIKRMQLIQTDANAWLLAQCAETKPAIVYLDPMFPPRKKSALVKKEMQLLQHLFGEATEHNGVDASEVAARTLLSNALACAKNRVIVKRPRTAKSLLPKKPTFILTGRAIRFEVYCK